MKSTSTPALFPCLHELFDAQAVETPAAIALVADETSWTYGDLDRRAGLLARHLRALGVGPEVPVGIFLDPSPERVMVLLAVLRAGGFYVPVDTLCPAERLAFLVEDSAALLWITEGEAAARLPVPGERLLRLDLLDLFDLDTAPPETGPVRLLADHPAYMIYTSGSTGRPKGVQVRHGAAVNMLRSMARRPGFAATDSILALTTLSFDIAVVEIFLPLAVGGRVVIAPRDTGSDPEAVAAWIERHGVTVVQGTPALWRLLVSSGWAGRPDLRIFCGGEALPRDLATALLARVGELWNLYGPTETTVWSALHPVGPGEGLVPLTEAVDDTLLLVLDDDLFSVPPGGEGELLIGGAGLARGYWRRPDLTAERFVPDPDPHHPGARLYRTGDLVRRRPDGALEYLGRFDHQVKIRGFRIELGEIEATLRSDPRVAEAVVTAVEVGPDDRRLTAYVVPGSGATAAASWQHEQVDQWRAIYDQVYDLDDPEREAGADRSVWHSSYTGQPISAAELADSRRGAVERILALAPQRVLEIGCGTGPILLAVAPRCAFYCGTDFSGPALEELRQSLAAQPEVAAKVELHERTAEDFSGFAPGSFDLVVLNSVLQHFPSLEYLLEVLAGAARRLRPGGFLFLGDVRCLPLLEAFHASVQLAKAPSALPRKELLRHLRRQVGREPELLLDPALFTALGERLPGWRRAWVWLKHGRTDNELNRFRYDVVLEAGPAEPAPALGCEELRWEELHGLTELRRRLTAQPAILAVRGIPNARLVRELQALARLTDPRGPETVRALRDALAREGEEGVHPEDLWDLAADIPYAVEVGWPASGEPGEYDVFFVPRTGAERAATDRFPPLVQSGAARPLQAYASNPLQGKLAGVLAPALRGFLKERLPDYMLPAAFVFLESLPLTLSGKVDRRALPAPELARAAAEESYVAPRDAVEEGVARHAADVLGLDRVGLADDFFSLGGHSLLGTQLIYRLRDTFGVDLPLNVLFEAPTLEGLAARIRERLAAEGQGAGRGEAVPQLVAAPEERFAPFPLNDIQQAYWIGRSAGLELGGIACRFYQQFDCRGLDVPRLEAAWQRLVARHDMLRAVVADDGQQRILESVPPYRIAVEDLRGEDEESQRARLAETRARMLGDLPPAGLWPLFAIKAHRLDEAAWRLHVCLELLVVDGLSILILFEEWGRLYADPGAELPAVRLTFRDYLVAEAAFESSERFRRARDYWLQRVPTLPPPPALPLAQSPGAIGRPEFVRYGTVLPAGVWQQLKQRAQASGLWPSSLLCAAYAEVLARWVREPAFTLNLTLFNRLPVHPEVNRVVGDFTTLDMLEVDGRCGGDFAARARLLQERLFLDLEHRAYSGVKVLRELARTRPGSAARMPVVFTSFLDDFARTDWLGPLVDRLGQTAQVWLDHVIMERAGALELDWYAVPELFPPALLPSMFEAYLDLLQRLAADEAVWREPRPVRLPAAELAERALANATAAPVSGELLHTLFAEQALRRPEAPAVIAPGRTLSYGELARRARLLARRLRQGGARPNELVAVVMEKGWEQVVAVLAILEAGAAYLPLEASLPQERLLSLLARGRATLALTQEAVDAQVAWPPEVRRFVVTAAAPEGDEPPLPPVQGPEDLAYVLFTSGSTGVPKGVMIDHRGAVNTVLDVNRRFGVGPEDRVFGISSLSFDLSVYDVFGTFAAGGALVLPAAAERNEPARWAERVERERVTLWSSVPALLELLLDHLEESPERRADSLRLVMLSGDWIPLSLPGRLRRRVPAAELVSLGGATEASIWSNYHLVERVEPDWRSVPYGRPLANQTFHVLDRDLEPCPVWVPGELYIGGLGLARGYFGDEERTRKSFIVHPATGERLYRTGDLGRYLPGGILEFLGREDGQVKVQGNRVELGEIESVLALHPAVKGAVVVARGPRDGAKRLIAYWVPAGGGEAGAAELRAHLAGKLPSYMVPSLFVECVAFPLSANGKVDRAALPEPAGASPAGGLAADQAAAPRDPVEEKLADLGADLLGVPVGRDASFFALGGNSLTAIRLVARLRDLFHVELPVARFFDAPTVETLAGALLRRQMEEQGDEAVALLLDEIEGLPDESVDLAVRRELQLLGW